MILPKGSTLQIGGGVTVAALRELTLRISREALDATTHGVSGMWKTFVKGWKEGEFSGTVYFLPQNVSHGKTSGLLQEFETAADTAAATTWTIFIAGTGALAANAVISGSGILTEFSGAIPAAEGMTATFTIKVTGAVTVGSFAAA